MEPAPGVCYHCQNLITRNLSTLWSSQPITVLKTPSYRKACKRGWIFQCETTRCDVIVEMIEGLTAQMRPETALLRRRLRRPMP
jgi:hypothetical protein